MCAARMHSEHPKCRVHPDAACVSGHRLFFLMPQPRRGAGGDDSDLEDYTSPLSDEPDSYEWRFPANKNWIQEFQHHDLSRHGYFTLGRFVAKFLPKIPGSQTI